MDIRKFPLDIIDLIKEVKKIQTPAFSVEIGDGEVFFVSLKDSSPNSDFYFKVLCKKQSDYFYYENKPWSTTDSGAGESFYSTASILKNIKSWLKMIESYSQAELTFEDIILESYYNKIGEDFKIIDNDANYAPYGFDAQITIVKFLDRVIDGVKKAQTEENKIEAAEIIKETEDLKKTISKSTKNEVFSKFKIILAKVWKFSMELGRQILADLASEIVKKALLGG